MLWAEHSETLLNHLVELRINRHSRVGAASWGTNGLQISVNNKQAGHWQNLKQYAPSLIKGSLAKAFYLKRRAPKEKSHRTRHHFQMYTHSWRCFRVPSTSQGAEPAMEARQTQQCQSRSSKKTWIGNTPRDIAPAERWEWKHDPHLTKPFTCMTPDDPNFL